MKAAFKGAAVASAVAALFATAQAQTNKTQPAEKKDKAGKMVNCQGINACKGQSACMTKDSSCSGMNACKGQGWLKVSEKECKAKGGKVLPQE